MDMLSLNRLMEQTTLIEGISEYVTDDNDYNVMTQKVNPNAMMESVEDVGGILNRGNDINGTIDFSALDNAISGLTECSNPALSTQVADKMKQPKVEAPKPVAKPVKKPVVTESSANNPSAGVTSADAFQNATPIKQTAFVTAKTASKVSADLEKSNTASEMPVTEHKSETAVDTQADKIMSAMRKAADANKKWEDISKKQNKITMNSVKFESFMKSMETEDNKALIESTVKAFDLLIKKYL